MSINETVIAARQVVDDMQLVMTKDQLIDYVDRLWAYKEDRSYISCCIVNIVLERIESGKIV